MKRVFKICPEQGKKKKITHAKVLQATQFSHMDIGHCLFLGIKR